MKNYLKKKHITVYNSFYVFLINYLKLLCAFKYIP